MFLPERKIFKGHPTLCRGDKGEHGHQLIFLPVSTKWFPTFGLGLQNKHWLEKHPTWSERCSLQGDHASTEFRILNGGETTQPLLLTIEVCSGECTTYELPIKKPIQIESLHARRTCRRTPDHKTADVWLKDICIWITLISKARSHPAQLGPICSTSFNLLSPVSSLHQTTPHRADLICEAPQELLGPGAPIATALCLRSHRSGGGWQCRSAWPVVDLQTITLDLGGLRQL